MKENGWDEWVRLVSEEYGLDLEKDKETEKQKRILEAAIHVFSEKGFEGASTNAIARRARVAEATIFKHYRTKKGLLMHLVIPAISKVAAPYLLRPVLKILGEDRPLAEIFQDLYADRVHLVEQNWKKIKIILVESLFQPELREAIQKHVAKAFYRVMEERVEEWKEKGRIREDLPTHVVARSIFSMGFGLILTKNMLPGLAVQEDEDKEIAWTAEALLHGIAGQREKG
ncbi:TetR/AcrR family transcriptional regulator [Salinithrix halophila]|uniref:TetR/AcrR family transcriptional regulator n=1 Tax=Salinithrix halophila TaxID=1485204 RepID=A0ABV8JDJ0_9BACL